MSDSESVSHTGNTISIGRKELRRYFASPIGYVLAIGSGLLFGLALYPSNPSRFAEPVLALSRFVPSSDLLRHPRLLLLVGLARVLTLFLIPMITMRLFVEEKRNGTLEMLFTSPVSAAEVILGKWLGALLMYLSILAAPVIELAVFRRPDVIAECYWQPTSH